MAPLYTHCPHCGFPAIVSGLDRARRCRQCRAEYTPGLPSCHESAREKARLTTPQRQRLALQARVKQRRRSLK